MVDFFLDILNANILSFGMIFNNFNMHHFKQKTHQT